MADTPKNLDDSDDGPVAQELDDLELEKWTDAFDALTNSTVGASPLPRPAGQAQPAPPPAGAPDDDADMIVEASEEPPARSRVGADVDRLFDNDGIEFGEALGDLLGAPPPLPLPDSHEEVISSAPRPARLSQPRMATVPPPLTGDLPPAPTDDEIFGEAIQKEFGAAIAEASPATDDYDENEFAPMATPILEARGGVGAAATPAAAAPPVARADDSSTELGEPAHEDSTRIADADAALLARSAAPSPSTDVTRKTGPLVPPKDTGRKMSIPGASDITHRTAPPLRRGPAVVRRGAPVPAPEPAGGGDFDEPQSTRVADADLMAQFAESAADPSDELRFDQPPPGAPGIGGPVGVELDDSFYDDIEIGSSGAAAGAGGGAGASAASTSAVPEVPRDVRGTGPISAGRRLTQNVVRRPTPAGGVPRMTPASGVKKLPTGPVAVPAPAPTPAQTQVPSGLDEGEEPESIEMVADEPDIAGDEAAAAADATLQAMLRRGHHAAEPEPEHPTLEAVPDPALREKAGAFEAAPPEDAAEPEEPSVVLSAPEAAVLEPELDSVPTLERIDRADRPASARPEAGFELDDEPPTKLMTREELPHAPAPDEPVATLRDQMAVPTLPDPVRAPEIPPQRRARTSSPPPPPPGRRSGRITVPPEPSGPPVPVAGMESGAVRALDLPALDLDATRFHLPETEAPDPEAPRQGAAERLAMLEAELRLTEAPVALARLRVEAGRAALATGDAQRARDHFEEALALDPGSAAAARALRRIAGTLGDHRGALAYLDVELSLLHEGEEMRTLAAWRADLLIAAGEQDLARVAYGELLDRRPDDPRALLAQLELAFADERDDEVCDTLSRAAANVHDSGFSAALLSLRGRLLARAGQADAARGALNASRAAAGESLEEARAAALTLTRLEIAAGRPAEAAIWSAAFVDGSSDAALAAAVHRRRARALFGAGDLPGAVEALEAALASAPGDPVLLESLSEAYEASDRHADALRVLIAWADVEPDAGQRAHILRRLAAQQAAQGDAAAAAASWARVAEADPADADAVADLEAARLAAGDVDAAAAMHHAAATSDPAAAYARVLAARIFERAGRLDEAIAELSAARAATPESAPLAESLARLLAVAGRWGELADLLIAHAEADPTRGEPIAARIRAARAAETAAAAAPEDAERAAGARAAWALAMEADGDDSAVRLARLRHAERERDSDPAALTLALADAQTSARDPALAADRALRRSTLAREAGMIDSTPLEQALAVDPLNARVHAELAHLDAAAARWEELARRQSERAEALSERPERDALRFAAAALLEERTEALAAAAGLLGPLAGARPGFLGARVLLERAFRRIGDPGALAAQVARSLGLAEGTSDGESEGPTLTSREPAALRFARLLELAELYESRVGDPVRALAAFSQALELRPDDPVAFSGFQRACEATGELRPLAERALAELERAEASNDATAKVAAYEELARIDGELRGDQASALIAWGTIAELDPTRIPALRALERHYIAEGAGAELSAILAKIEALCDAPGDQVALAMARARLDEQQGRAGDALEHERRALAAAPGTRMALFRLETHARDAGASAELAGLEEAIATFFTGDARAQGSFLARAGDVHAQLGQAADAGARYRAATEVMPDHVPALHAWRRIALGAELWPDAVEALEREAAVARTNADKARLYHLAAATAMDKAQDPDKAGENLRRVLVLDPRHDDALVRLRQLYQEQGRYEDLVQLLSTRVESETDRARLIELHTALAGLFRDFLGDRERAKTHLRAVIQRDPVNVAAVGALSDIAWEQGQWQEAADTLIQRARLEKNPRILKEVFYRLGLIYAERLPDPKWALKSFERVLQIEPDDDSALEHLSRLAIETQDWRLALGATERLISIDTEPASKIEHLHRVARIQQEGFREPKRAEDALKRALDVDPADPRTLDAITAFYGAQKDLTSLRVQMDRVAGSMRTRLKRDAHDATAYRVISRALAARARAQVVGSIEAARCAAELAHALGGAEDAERMLAAEALRSPSSAKGLGNLAVDDALFHPSIPSGFRQVFRLLHDTLSKRYTPELRRWGVGKADKLPRAGHPVKDLALGVAVDLGIADIDVYVSTTQPTALGVELTDPLTLVIGAHLAHAEKPPQLRFAVGRALKLAISYMGVPARLTPEELGSLLGGVIRQYDPNYAAPGVSAGLVAEEQQRLGRLISKRLRDEVYPFASEVAGLELDPRSLWAGVQHTGNRAGLIASSSALAGLVVLLRIGNHKDIPSSRGDKLIEEFMRFAVSDEHAEVRRVLASGGA